jgi:hypothetical protein
MTTLHTHNRTHHSESPDFGIKASAEELASRKWYRGSIATVFVHAIDDELRFPLGDEFPRVGRLFGKIDERPVAEYPEEHCQGSFNDEDPSPLGYISCFQRNDVLQDLRQFALRGRPFA